MLNQDRTHALGERDASAFPLLTGVTWIQAVPASGPLELAWRDTSDEVSNDSDRRFLVSARAQADFIVTSAKTAAAESYRPSRYAPIVVLDRSAVASTPDELRLLRSGDIAHADALTAVETLAREKSILLESGPTLAKVFAHSGSIQRVWLTVTGFREDFDSLERARITAKRIEAIGVALGLERLTQTRAIWDGQNEYLDLIAGS